ncbi:MAG: putative ABC transport system permease protein, partial [Saprospiraceae bacterium]
MYKKYFKIAYRILLRKKGYSVINIGGLAIGMITAMLIGLWVQDELSFDNYHANSDRNAQVMQHRTINGHVETHPIIPIPLEEELRSRYGSDFKYLVTSFWEQEQVLSYKDKKVTKNGNYMGKDAIQLFSLNMLKGTNDGLVEPSSILLSESTANVIFGDIDPMGKLMKINNEMNVAVTGIYEDLPKNSSLHGLAFMSSWELFVSSQDWIKNAREQNNWDMGSFQLFVQLADQVDMQEVSNKIKMVTHEHIGEFEKAYNPQLFLHPMADWHLKSNWKNGMQTGGLIQFVWLFSIIGILVLVLACINFMNLSTAQSEKRSKEVGIRKSLGSMRSQLISQFMTESFLVVLLAFVVTISMVYLVIPYFNELADKNIILPINRFAFWGIAIGFIIITGLLAGSYPALYLSSFRPVEVLKGTFKTGKSAVTFRRGLVILQFTISIALVIGAIVVEKQIQFTKDRPMGYDTNGAIMIWSNSPDFKGKYDLLSTVLKNKQAITEMSESSSPLTGIFSVDGDISWEGKDPNAQVNFASIRVTHEYGKTVDWEIIDGRDFSKEYGADSTALILNATAAEYMNFKNPIGEVIESGNGASAAKFIVVGLINDMLMESPFQAIQPTIYTVGNSSRTKMDCMTMKLN